MLAEPGFDDGGVLATAAVDALHVPHHLGLLEDQRLRQNLRVFTGHIRTAEMLKQLRCTAWPRII